MAAPGATTRVARSHHRILIKVPGTLDGLTDVPGTLKRTGPMNLTDLSTPVPVVDVARLHANLARMADYTRQHDLALRPHVKTHKSRRVAGV